MEQKHTEEIENVALSSIFTLPGSNPFASDSAESMRPLLDSIRKDGVQQPIMLTKRAEGGYYLIDGHRRCCAAYLAHIENVPAHIQELTLQQSYKARITANLSWHQETGEDRPEPQAEKSRSIITLIKAFFSKSPKQNREKHHRRGRGR